MLRRCSKRCDRLILIWAARLRSLGLCRVTRLTHVFLDYVIAAGVAMLLTELLKDLHCRRSHPLWQRCVLPDDLVDYFNPRSQCRADAVAYLLGLRWRQLLRKFPDGLNGKSDMQCSWSLRSCATQWPAADVKSPSVDSSHIAPHRLASYEIITIPPVSPACR